MDAGGILHVGPESAGADPGPACYGRGGTAATVTDANWCWAARSRPASSAGAPASTRRPRSRAVEGVAAKLGLELLAAAEGIHRVVNTNMAEGIRLVSVRRGADPRRFALLSFGGAAGLHITEVARMLEISRVVVPRVASVLSAWGMLATDLRYEFVRTHVGEAGQVGAARAAQALRRDGGGGAAAPGRRRSRARSDVRRSVDMRYGEQTFEIQVPLDGVDVEAKDLMEQVVERFHQRHEELYTYSAPGQDVVLVNVARRRDRAAARPCPPSSRGA